MVGLGPKPAGATDAPARRYWPTRLTAWEPDRDRIEKSKNDVYSFEELDTLEKNATQLGDRGTLVPIEIGRASKAAKGEKPKTVSSEDEAPRINRYRSRRS